MATPIRKIRVMLSSRNKDRIPDGKGSVTLEEVRRELQATLQEEQFCGYALLEVWINENAGAEDGTGDVWDQCLKQVDECDILVVIYNGHAGWTKEGGAVGICHAELMRAWNLYPAKLRLIALRFGSRKHLGLVSPDDIVKQNASNRRFGDFIKTANLFVGQAEDRASLVEQVSLAVAKSVSELVALGKRESRKGKYHLGESLDWSRFNYQQRKEELEAVVRAYLQGPLGADHDSSGVILTISSAKVLVSVHGVPDSFGIAEARDLVGRPYLNNHTTTVAAGKTEASGPIHVIACHKSCTTTQIISFMGHPDLFLVETPFGFFAADQVNFAQTFFVTSCRDEATTLLGVQRMFDWIEQSGEAPRIVARAESRANILRAVAAEIARRAQ
jgi:hypothetical protein